MDTKDIILELRMKKGMSQDELAEKVFVTRQAVSRWETGETTPNTETLKLLSKLFDVSINTLLGSPRQLICQCCGMPLEDSNISKETDGFFNEEFCKWCYADGEYTYDNMDDLIEFCAGHMANEHFSPELFAYMLVFFLLGFLIYAFLYGAISSTVSKLEDINTAVQPVTFLFLFGFMVVMFSMSSGSVDNILMQICSYIPFTSPMAMFTRIAMSTVPWYEITISIGILVASTFGIGILSAKIYRVGVLMYGTSPKIGNIIKAVWKA